MIRLGLTGSLAMGKSTAARMFSALGVPVFDSDDAVHLLYSTGGRAVGPLSARVQDACVGGHIDRERLSAAIRRQPQLLKDIESIVHPLIFAEQQRFLSACAASGAPFAIVDSPLLFETGREKEFDRVIVVTCSPELQRERALARAGMSPQKLEFLLARQVPDGRKRQLADHVIDTSGSFEDTERQVSEVVSILTGHASKMRNDQDA